MSDTDKREVSGGKPPFRPPWIDPVRWDVFRVSLRQRHVRLALTVLFMPKDYALTHKDYL